MGTDWLTDSEMAAWRAYIETAGDLYTALEKDLVAHGLTLGDYQVFVFLSDADDDSMRMRDLAEALQLSPSGLTRRLDGLVQSGHVVRAPSTEDGRVMMAVLTDAGRALLDSTSPDHVTSVRRRIFDHLDDAQVEAMTSIFTAIAAGLASESSADGNAA